MSELTRDMTGTLSVARYEAKEALEDRIANIVAVHSEHASQLDDMIARITANERVPFAVLEQLAEVVELAYEAGRDSMRADVHDRFRDLGVC